MLRFEHAKYLCALTPMLTVMVLAACGGGGGGSGPSFTVGGTVSGLAGSGLVLRDNGGDSLSVSGNGPFTFQTPVADGQSYTVTLGSQPANPFQTCAITNGTGRLSGSPVTTVTVGCITTPLALFAGNLGGFGTTDGTGAAARFLYPTAVATDSAGNVYVADTYSYTIRKITPDGVVSTFAGTAGASGSADGTGAAARFASPSGVATDSAGTVYVADAGALRKITPAGVVSTLASGAGAKYGVATDSAGNVYLTAENTVRKITPDGTVTLAGTPGTYGSADGVGPAARFNGPYGIATDSADSVYVADSRNLTIRKITPDGVVSTLAGTAGIPGSADGLGPAARFGQYPTGVATDNAGNVYVADTLNRKIRKITPAGMVSTLAGTFEDPEGVATDGAGNVYVADTLGGTVGKIAPDAAVTTIAGAAPINGSADGVGASAAFSYPAGVATDSAGNVYVADSSNNTIRKITPGSVVSTFAGQAGSEGSVDGVGPAARFFTPMGVATDSAGNVYVADANNGTIRKITPAGTVSTLAGSAPPPYGGGSTDGVGSAARFNYPKGIATDSAGNVYVADTLNNTVRKIAPAGVVSTLAGTAGTSGSADGVGPAARFLGPDGIATDSAGNVYVADTGNHTVRKITADGVVSTLAGAAGTSGSTDGVGPAARFGAPIGLATDKAGNVYVADGGSSWSCNCTIRKITPSGEVSTVVGTLGQQGFEQGPLPGMLGPPVGVAIGGTSLYITIYNGVVAVQGLL